MTGAIAVATGLEQGFAGLVASALTVVPWEIGVLELALELGVSVGQQSVARRHGKEMDYV